MRGRKSPVTVRTEFWKANAADQQLLAVNEGIPLDHVLSAAACVAASLPGLLSSQISEVDGEENPNVEPLWGVYYLVCLLDGLVAAANGARMKEAGA